MTVTSSSATQTTQFCLKVTQQLIQYCSATTETLSTTTAKPTQKPDSTNSPASATTESMTVTVNSVPSTETTTTTTQLTSTAEPTTTTRAQSTTTPGTTQTVFVSFSSSEIFVSDLSNPASEAYKNREKNVNDTLTPFFRNALPSFKGLAVIQFRNGSIITDMNVTFGTLPSDVEIENTIMKANATLSITSVTTVALLHLAE
ncbi:hypothetical protein cypCar_00048836, partial [Cyprinus carpio]